MVAAAAVAELLAARERGAVASLERLVLPATTPAGIARARAGMRP